MPSCNKMLRRVRLLKNRKEAKTSLSGHGAKTSDERYHCDLKVRILSIVGPLVKLPSDEKSPAGDTGIALLRRHTAQGTAR